MKQTIFIIILGIFFIQCQNQDTPESPILSEKKSHIQYLKRNNPNTYSPSQQDSLQRNFEDTFNILHHIEETGYLPIYTFSDNIMGLRFDGYEFETGAIFEGFKFIESEKSGIEIWYDNDKAKWNYKGVTIVEQTPLNVILENEKLTALLSNIYTEEYTIICTKGTVQREFSNIYFAQDDCYSNFIYFAFAPIDTTIYGEPLWAVVSNTLDVQPVENKELEHFCTMVFDFAFRYSDFYDQPNNNNGYQILGEHDGYFLAYRDDFKWRNGDKNAMKFPSRILIKKEGEAFKIKNSHSLDLFGIPCL